MQSISMIIVPKKIIFQKLKHFDIDDIFILFFIDDIFSKNQLNLTSDRIVQHF